MKVEENKDRDEGKRALFNILPSVKLNLRGGFEKTISAIFPSVDLPNVRPPQNI